MAMNLDELKKLSPKLKALIVCLFYVLIGYGYYMLILEATLETRANLSTKLTELQQQVSEKEKAVAQLDKYIREIKQLQETFKEALLKLPNEREIAGLLASVVLSGQDAGINFLLFEPKPPEKKPPDAKPGSPPAKPADAKDAKGPPKPPVQEKFYDEIPVRVQLAGGFPNVLSFYDRVARLSRIVNIEDIEMAEGRDGGARGWTIKTSCIVKTYMFVDKKQ
jgi:type IV pilus assembly protein PilO